MIYLVSACLAGIKCRYDGTACTNEKIAALVREGKAIPVCPEQLGGLSTPRPCSEIATGKVMTKDGRNVTKEYREGAEKTLAIAKAVGAETAILKANSPSCGCGQIYDGTFSGRKIKGNGITAELLLKNGINVLNENDLAKL